MIEVCSKPEIMEVMYIFNLVINIIKILVPIVLIITGMLSFLKVMLSEKTDIKDAVNTFITKLVVGAFIFFIPTIINSLVSLADSKSNYIKCFTNATKDNIKASYLVYAKKTLEKAEKTSEKADYEDAFYYVNKLEDGTVKTNYLKRLEAVNKAMKDHLKSLDKTPTVTLNPTSYSSSGNAVPTQEVTVLTSEPDPSLAINYWSQYVSSSDFVYPKDTKTGLPLGAWPKNYASIPTRLTSYNTYKGAFIFPVTPSGGVYQFGYRHGSIDIASKFGEPVYSPVDGQLYYSMWGNTVNKGSDETAYSVAIMMSNPTVIGGKKISIMYLTHMSGIVNRCNVGKCNKQIKRGDLLGFVGTAARSAEKAGWAPHLHMTFYDKNWQYIYTEAIHDLYGIYSGKSIRAGG